MTTRSTFRGLIPALAAALLLLATASVQYADAGGAPRGGDPHGADEVREASAGESVLASDVDALRERWGVEVLQLRVTASGYLLDFRYRVHDAEKAAPLLARRARPYVVVAKSNARLGVPVTNKLGALRQSTQHAVADRNYFILFTNPGRHVVPGDRVNVVIGDFVAEDVTVIQ